MFVLVSASGWYFAKVDNNFAEGCITLDDAKVFKSIEQIDRLRKKHQCLARFPKVGRVDRKNQCVDL